MGFITMKMTNCRVLYTGQVLEQGMVLGAPCQANPYKDMFTGECPAVDFESQMYRECMDVLVHHVKPIRTLSGVVLEQSYLNKMAEGIQPLALLALTAQGHTVFNLPKPTRFSSLIYH